MKEINLWRNTFLILFSVSLYSCDNDEKIADNLYEQREYLISEFKDKCIDKRGDKLYQLSYYKGEAVNTFFFERRDTVFVLTRDTLQYPVNQIAAFTSIDSSGQSGYGTALSKELNRLLNVMKDLKIHAITADFKFARVDMKIYFGDFKALLYVENLENVKNQRWKDYIYSGKKYNSKWYYVKDETEKSR